MSKVEFNFKSTKTIIQCNPSDTMKDIIQKFLIKVQCKMDDLDFLYNGYTINESLLFSEIVNETDKARNEMSIVVSDKEPESGLIIKRRSKDIICPNCYETSRMLIKDYNISLYDCKNGHKKDNILFSEFENTQLMDESKIICEKCKNNNKSKTFKNKFYICTSCKVNICPLCKTIHDKSHNIIDYD